MKTAIAVKVIFKVVSAWFLVNLLKELHLLVTHMQQYAQVQLSSYLKAEV